MSKINPVILSSGSSEDLSVDNSSQHKPTIRSIETPATNNRIIQDESSDFSPFSTKRSLSPTWQTDDIRSNRSYSNTCITMGDDERKPKRKYSECEMDELIASLREQDNHTSTSSSTRMKNKRRIEHESNNGCDVHANDFVPLSYHKSTSKGRQIQYRNDIYSSNGATYLRPEACVSRTTSISTPTNRSRIELINTHPTLPANTEVYNDKYHVNSSIKFDSSSKEPKYFDLFLENKNRYVDREIIESDIFENVIKVKGKSFEEAPCHVLIAEKNLPLMNKPYTEKRISAEANRFVCMELGLVRSSSMLDKTGTVKKNIPFMGECNLSCGRKYGKQICAFKCKVHIHHNSHGGILGLFVRGTHTCQASKKAIRTNNDVTSVNSNEGSSYNSSHMNSASLPPFHNIVRSPKRTSPKRNSMYASKRIPTDLDNESGSLCNGSSLNGWKHEMDVLKKENAQLKNTNEVLVDEVSKLCEINGPIELLGPTKLDHHALLCGNNVHLCTILSTMISTENDQKERIQLRNMLSTIKEVR